jgi:flagellar protein FliL
MAATATAEIADLGADEPKGKGKKKLIIMILLPLLVLGAVVGGLVFMGIVKLPGGSDTHAEEAHAEPEKHEEPKALVFFEVPDMLVNLSSTGKRTNYLKIRVSLELAKAEDAAILQERAPRLIDNFQSYLRELRISDLQGSAGLARLREELLRRVNAAVEPVKVRDVLFREMLVQ